MSRVARPCLQPPRAVIRRAAGHRPPVPKLIRIAPRSAVAGATEVRPAIAAASGTPPDLVLVHDDAGTEGAGSGGRLRAIRRRLAALAAAALVVAVLALAAGGTRVVLATFTDQADVGASFATGTWSEPTTWYLHNDPTPPTGNTPARALLAMDATAPTGTTLHNYDTGCDSRPGRRIARGAGSAAESTACRFATWRSAPLAAGRTVDGTASLAIWARKAASGGTNPTLRAYLRVLDPGTGTYQELGAADATVIPNANQAWARLDLAWAFDAVTVPAGSQLEVLVVATGGTRDAEIAYDTTGQPSALTLP
jgi:hypothetical protein